MGTPAGLAACVAVDPVNYSLCKAMALGDESGSFPAFVGETERERMRRSAACAFM